VSVKAPSVAAPDTASAPASAAAPVIATLPTPKRRRRRRRRARFRPPPPTTTSPQPPPTKPFIRQPPLYYYSHEFFHALIPSFVAHGPHAFNWEDELNCVSSARLYILPPLPEVPPTLSIPHIRHLPSHSLSH
jgi:hypothetical protein